MVLAVSMVTFLQCEQCRHKLYKHTRMCKYNISFDFLQHIIHCSDVRVDAGSIWNRPVSANLTQCVSAQWPPGWASSSAANQSSSSLAKRLLMWNDTPNRLLTCRKERKTGKWVTKPNAKGSLLVKADLNLQCGTLTYKSMSSFCQTNHYVNLSVYRVFNSHVRHEWNSHLTFLYHVTINGAAL